MQNICIAIIGPAKLACLSQLSLLTTAVSELSVCKLIAVGSLIEEKVNRLGVHKVQLLANVSNVDEKLSQSDVLVVSLSSENLPVALLKATMSGLSSMVTNVGGCAEITEETATYFFIETNSTEKFERVLRRMIEGGSLREHFPKNALYYSARFRIETAVNEYDRVYTDALRGTKEAGYLEYGS